MNGNVNDIKEIFTYVSKKASNTPSKESEYYFTTIALSDNFIYQEAKRVNSHRNNFINYERQCYKGSWTEWRKTSSTIITTGVEFETGRIIDGKKEYGKRIDIGNLPNATSKSIVHGLVNFNQTGICLNIRNSEGLECSFGSYGLNPATSRPLITYNNTLYITIYASDDMSKYTGKVTLYYIKN